MMARTSGTPTGGGQSDFNVFSDPEIKLSNFFKEVSKLEIDEDFQNLSLNRWGNPLEKNYRDPINEYKLNALGYRSGELAPADFVTAGCSVTFGVGVPYAGIWSSLLAKELDLSHINLASPGWSTESIVEHLFKYFYKYGNPKTVVVLFPDCLRVDLVSDRDFSVVKPNENDPPIKVVRSNLYNTPTKTRAKYSKKPYDLLRFIAPEYGVYRAFKAINSLIIYCKSAGITLLWGTWDLEMHRLASAAKDDWNKDAYSGYVSHFDDYFDSYSADSLKGNEACHQEFLEVFGDNFYHGYDGILDKDSVNKSHPGVHYHIHIFERFYRSLNQIS
jgi:hypothetical protein